VCETCGVPLSDNEKRILSEIEDQLYVTDPDLAREVSSTTVYSDSARVLRWATLGALLGLAMMLLTLTRSYLLAFAGFVIMLAAVYFVERSLRQLGKVSVDQFSQALKRRSAGGFAGANSARLRGRFGPQDGPPPPSAS